MLHSTETALLRVQHDIASELDKNHAMLFVMLDLSSAFDTIDHEHLLTLYADDIHLYASYNPAKPDDQVETARRLTDCIGEIRRWMAVRMLKLNNEKTNMTIFSLKHHLNVYGGCSLTIGDDTVSPSHRIRNLGVHMDKKSDDDRSCDCCVRRM